MISRHKKNKSFLLICAIVFTVALSGGCAYYNTFYNIKKEFRAAEKQTLRAQVGVVQDRPAQVGQGLPNGVPLQQYQGILTSCAKLLEFYPDTRWIDDALMIMGVSYFRMEEFARAERKFTELVTIFPNSKHQEMSKIWRARSLLAQDKYDEAEAVLTSTEGQLKTTEAIAASARTLAGIYDKRERPEEAVKYLEQIRDISYDRDEKASDYLTLGRSYQLLDRNSDATAALQKCLSSTRNVSEAFLCRKLMADIAALDGEYAVAQEYLRPLQTDRRFTDMAGDVLVELASVEAIAGDPARSIKMLEEYCADAPQGETKARAYYAQGAVARDKLFELELSKSKFDSVAGAGASRPLQDSARAASMQLEAGLKALAKIPILKDSLQTLSELSSIEILADTTISEVQDTIVNSEPALKDSNFLEEMSFDSATPAQATEETLATSALVDSSRVLVKQDSSLIAVVKSDTMAPYPADEQNQSRSPAEMIADSILNALSRHDSTLKAATMVETILDSTSISRPDSAKAPIQVKAPTTAELRKTKIADISNRLINAHLEAATFYENVLHQSDSALSQIEQAVLVPDSSADHWRAMVQLGLALREQGEDSYRANTLFESAANAELASIEVRNAARGALGLPQERMEKSEQERALSLAEQSLLSDVSIEHVILAYRDVIALDSVSSAGSIAWQAIAYLQEYKQNSFEAAMKTHEDIIRLFPDSEFVETSKQKLLPPDSLSIFLLSDEVLEETMQPALEFLTAESDSSGWPPEESTLLGRRFR